MEAGQVGLGNRLRQPQVERAVVVVPGDELDVLRREQFLGVVERAVLAKLGVGHVAEPEHRRLGQHVAEIGLGAAHHVVGAARHLLGQGERAADRRRAALEVYLDRVPALGVDFLDQRLEGTAGRAADREAARRRQRRRRRGRHRRPADRGDRDESSGTTRSDTLCHLKPPLFVMPTARVGHGGGLSRTLRERHGCCPRAMSARRRPGG